MIKLDIKEKLSHKEVKNFTNLLKEFLKDKGKLSKHDIEIITNDNSYYIEYEYITLNNMIKHLSHLIKDKEITFLFSIEKLKNNYVLSCQCYKNDKKITKFSYGLIAHEINKNKHFNLLEKSNNFNKEIASKNYKDILSITSKYPIEIIEAYSKSISWCNFNKNIFHELVIYSLFLSEFSFNVEDFILFNYDLISYKKFNSLLELYTYFLNLDIVEKKIIKHKYFYDDKGYLIDNNNPYDVLFRDKLIKLKIL